MKAHELATVLTVALACGSCSYGNEGVDPRSLSSNPHPGPAVEITGSIPDRFSVDKLRVVYATASSSPFCNGLELPDRGPFPLRSTLYVPTKRVGDKVVAQVQPDKFASGPCRWELSGVYAVLRNAVREETQPLVAIGYDWGKSHGLLGDAEKVGYTSTFYCGYKHGPFMCGDGAVGDTSYYPVEIKTGVRQAQFVIHESGYRAPPGYHTPLRNDEGVPVYRMTQSSQ